MAKSLATVLAKALLAFISVAACAFAGLVLVNIILRISIMASPLVFLYCAVVGVSRQNAEPTTRPPYEETPEPSHAAPTPHMAESIDRLQRQIRHQHDKIEQQAAQQAASAGRQAQLERMLAAGRQQPLFCGEPGRQRPLFGGEPGGGGLFGGTAPTTPGGGGGLFGGEPGFGGGLFGEAAPASGAFGSADSAVPVSDAVPVPDFEPSRPTPRPRPRPRRPRDQGCRVDVGTTVRYVTPLGPEIHGCTVVARDDHETDWFYTIRLPNGTDRGVVGGKLHVD